MSRPVCELENLLEQLIAEHRKLLEQVEKHLAAMKAFDLRTMDDVGRVQEATRLRIAAIEQRRRMTVLQIGKALNQPGELSLRKLAAFYPAHAASLMRMREELKSLVERIAARTRINAKLSAAMLGHLNTAVRLLAGAVERAGLYTRSGTPRFSPRIGVMEAVG